MHSKILATLLFSAATLTAQGGTVFVTTAGSDVTGDGSFGSPFASIEKAAAEASFGDVINVGAGTFAGVTTPLGDKQLTIRGAGVGQTVVTPIAGISLNAGFLPGTPTPHTVGLAIDGPFRVDVAALTVDCQNQIPANGRLVGIFVGGGSDSTIDQVEVVNAAASPLDGNQRPTAVLVRGDGASSANVTLRECQISGFGKAAASAFFDANLRAEYCEIRGAARNLEVAQVGLQAGFGATATFRNNRISDLSFTGGNFASSAVLLFDAGLNNEITGNLLSGNDDGIAIINTAQADVDAVVNSNTVTGSLNTAMRVELAGGVDALGNRFHMANSGLTSVFDDASSGNSYADNSYSDYAGFGPFLIAGGSIFDATPSNGVFEVDGAATSQVTPSSFTAFTLADLDGQNGLDIAAVAQNVTPQLLIGLEDGAGGYNFSVLPLGLATAEVVDVAAGNFFPGGGTDLAVLTRSVPPTTNQDTLRIFLGFGTGAFFGASATQLVGVEAPTDLASADLNGDGVGDFVVTSAGLGGVDGSARVLLNNGSGAIGSQTDLPGLTGRFGAVAIGDLGSGNNDLLVAGGDTVNGEAFVFTNDGSAGFTQTSSFSTIEWPTAAAIGDINQDGNNDAFVAGQVNGNEFNPGVVTMGLNNGAGFDTSDFDVDAGPTQLIVTDLDTDSDPNTVRPDVLAVCPTGGSIAVLGSFENGRPTAGGLAVIRDTMAFNITEAPGAAAATDLNGDGITDLVISEANSSDLRTVLGQASPRTELFGFGCPGEFGRRPFITAEGDVPFPRVGNAGFQIGLSNARAGSLSALFFGIGVFPFQQECLPSIDVIVISVPTATNLEGRAFVAAPIPNDPSIVGQVTLQWATLDLTSAFTGASLSDAMQLRIQN